MRVLDESSRQGTPWSSRDKWDLEKDKRDNWGGKSPNDQQEEKKHVVCYGCQKVGHIRSNCPNAKGKVALIKQSDRWACNTDIGKQLLKDYREYLWNGHIKASDNESGLGVIMLRDSGATQSCVLRSSLPKEFKFQRNNFALVGGFPNTVVPCPLEKLYLDCKRFKGYYRFAVVDALPIEGIQVVIGNDIAGVEMGEPTGFAVGPSESVEVTRQPVSVMTQSQQKEYG